MGNQAVKLHRPYIPMDVRANVAWQQAYDAGLRPELTVSHRWSFKDQLHALLYLLFGDEDFHLDHDPALTNRQFNPRTKKYTPDANDPSYLVYRREIDHDIKTRVRGDGAQLSDLGLRRKLKRIAERRAKKKKWKPRRAKVLR